MRTGPSLFWAAPVRRPPARNRGKNAARSGVQALTPLTFPKYKHRSSSALVSLDSRSAPAVAVAGEFPVIMRRRTSVLLGGLVVIALSCGALHAEEVEKKFRVGLSFGGYNTQSAIRSESGNALLLTDDAGTIVERYLEDPRLDQVQISELKIKPATRIAASVAYAFHRFFLVEFVAGYQKADVGNVELQAQFVGVDPDPLLRFAFEPFLIPVGEMEQVPLQLTAVARFRPKASFNPYLGIGAGYTIVGFEPSNEINEISLNMDSSRGGFAPVSFFGFGAAENQQDLRGAEIDARDTFEWHVLGGAEYGFKRKWAAFVEARYVFASRTMSVKFNGENQLGISVPNRRESINSEFGVARYGPWEVPFGAGGIIDGGRLVPGEGVDTEGLPDDEFCAANLSDCDFVFAPDGIPDPGYYYVKGGELKYGGISIEIGIKYTF